LTGRIELDLDERAFTVVDVVSDSPEWEQERSGSLGASESPAILGLSPWDTPLSIWRRKKGAPDDFDPVLGFIGHRSEVIIAEWVERFSDQAGVKLEPAFMARSVECPWLHASFDRISHDETGRLVTWQFKTAHQYGSHHWDEGVPTDIRVQVQQEIFVAGTEGAWVVVWIGGREFRMFWEPRDERFIRDYLIPTTEAFWFDHVVAAVAPEPSTLAEVDALMPGDADHVLDGDERLYDLWSEFGRQQALEKEAAQMLDVVKLELKKAMQAAEAIELRHDGKTLFTWKQNKPTRVFDKKRFEADHPDLAAEYTSTRPGNRPFFRKTVKQVTHD